MKKEKALAHLGQSIKDLQIKDKALEQTIRHFIFQNDEEQILNVMKIYMPEFSEAEIPKDLGAQKNLLKEIAEEICPGRKFSIETESLKNCVLLNLEFDGSLFGLTIGIVDTETLGASDSPRELRYYVDAEYSGLENEAEELEYALKKAIKRMPGAFTQRNFNDLGIQAVKEQLDDADWAEACAHQKWQYII